MNYKVPQMAAKFFMTSLNRNRGGGGWTLWLPPPPGSSAEVFCCNLFFSKCGLKLCLEIQAKPHEILILKTNFLLILVDIAQ